MESTPTESSAGVTLLYIANHLSYKPRQDFNIYKKNELGSIFIETVNPETTNIIFTLCINILQWIRLILIVIT